MKIAAIGHYLSLFFGLEGVACPLLFRIACMVKCIQYTRSTVVCGAGNKASWVLRHTRSMNYSWVEGFWWNWAFLGRRTPIRLKFFVCMKEQVWLNTNNNVSNHYTFLERKQQHSHLSLFSCSQSLRAHRTLNNTVHWAAPDPTPQRRWAARSIATHNMSNFMKCL